MTAQGLGLTENAQSKIVVDFPFNAFCNAAVLANVRLFNVVDGEFGVILIHIVPELIYIKTWLKYQLMVQKFVFFSMTFFHCPFTCPTV